MQECSRAMLGSAGCVLANLRTGLDVWDIPASTRIMTSRNLVQGCIQT